MRSPSLLLLVLAVGGTLGWHRLARGDEASTPSPSASPAAFVAGGLTADEVARRAVGTSAELRAREAERRVAEAGLRQAVAEYVPRVSGLARYTRLSSTDSPPLGNVVLAPTLAPGAVPGNTGTEAFVVVPLSFPVLRNQWTAQATVQVPLSDYVWRIPEAHAAARHNVQAAALTERAVRRNVATEARVSFYNCLRARLQREVAEQAVAQAQSHLAEVTKSKQVGTTSDADVLRVTSQLAAAELLLTRTRSLGELTEQQLRTWMHEDPARDLRIGEDLRSPPPPIMVDAANLSPLWDEALSRRLERRALDASAGGERAHAQAARAAGLPRLVAVGNLASSNPNPRVFPQQDRFSTTWDAGIQLMWTPTELMASEASHDQAASRALALEAQRDALDDTLRMQVTQAALALSEAHAAVTTTARGLAAAEESYRVRRLLFQNGRATSIEESDAETDLTRARFEVINAAIDVRTAALRLEHALGRDELPDTPR